MLLGVALGMVLTGWLERWWAAVVLLAAVVVGIPPLARWLRARGEA